MTMMIMMVMFITGNRGILNIPPRCSHFTKIIYYTNTANVPGGKAIAIRSQSVSFTTPMAEKER
jgi:hypothetical protein